MRRAILEALRARYEAEIAEADATAKDATALRIEKKPAGKRNL